MRVVKEKVVLMEIIYYLFICLCEWDICKCMFKVEGEN